MVCKYLEKKLILVPEDMDEEFKRTIELDYYLLESEASDSDFVELKEKKIYGIEIVKKVDSKEIENKVVRNFSCCRDNAMQTVNRLAKNTVTPMAMSYILDDILGE